MASGTSTTFTNQSCSPVFTTPTDTLDWGTPVDGSIFGPAGSNTGGLGPASMPPWPADPGSTLNAGVGGIGVQITSNDELTRADNTELAWNGTTWVPAFFTSAGADNNYFFGHFNAPSSPSAPAAFGDDLLGALAYPGGQNAPPTITMTFSTALEWVGFQVSSANSSNFTAELLAFNSSGQIGTYMINSTGGGGFCPGLSMSPPQPCADAPLIQFYDQNATITSVELVLLNDASGVYIDSLEVAVPEPASFAYVAAAIFLLIALRSSSFTSASTWLRSAMKR